MSHASPDWQALRREFPILDQDVHGHPLIYLDNAATSQKPESVIDAIAGYYRRDNANVHRGVHALSTRATEAYEGSRERTARFINAAESREILFTTGTTEGINLVASSWARKNLQRGDRILLTEIEHHSNMVPWQMVAEETGAELAYLPLREDESGLDLDRLDALLDSGVRLLAFTHVSNTMGIVNPAELLCQKARERGVVTLVDGAQSIGHMPVDVQAMGCDFYSFGAHKAAGPTGFGGLYGRASLLDSMGPYRGGGEMIESVGYHRSTYNVIPHRFEAGTPNISGAVGWNAAMEFLDGVGREAIAEHDRDLAGYAYGALSQIPGIRIFGPKGERSGVVSFRIQGAHALDLVSFCDTRGLALRGGHHCNQPLMAKLGVDTTARMSFYLYNSREEIDRAVQIIDDVRRLLTA